MKKLIAAKFKKILSLLLTTILLLSTISGGVLAGNPPPEQYKNLEQYPQLLKDWYKKRMGKELNLDNPQTYNEKMQWLKLWDSTPIKTKLADKYLVREWIKEKIGEKYLVPLLGVWDNFDDIDFDKLPNKFVLKANHGSGWNIIVDDKSKFNKAEAKKKFDKWLKTDFAFKFGFELHYHNIKPKIIAEEHIENDNNDLYDYKVFCFDGKAMYTMFLSERKHGLKMAFYDNDWNLQPFHYNYPQNDVLVKKPDKLKEILSAAEKLSKDFSHVRVDFYVLNDGTIKFGEMTFTSCSGDCKWMPDHNKINKYFGDLITLPKEKYDYRKIFEDDKKIMSNQNEAKKDNIKPNENKPSEDKKSDVKPSANKATNDAKKEQKNDENRLKNITESWIKNIKDSDWLNKIKDKYLK